MRPLVLASASPARLRLLHAAGFAPLVLVSGVDESGVSADTIGELVVSLARAKATAVAALPGARGAVVIGCDSLLDVDGRAHGKPDSVDEARSRLQRLRGTRAVLHTGHCVIDTIDGRVVSDIASTEVCFGTFSDTELDAYLATPEPMEVAGAFTLDGRSAPFIDGIIGDHSNVIGLSLPLFRALLARLDLSVMDFWV